MTKREIFLPEGCLNGYGLFETMRAVDKNIVYFDQHINRISKDGCSIGLSLPSKKKLKSYILDLVRKKRLPDAYVKLACLKSVRGTDVIVVVKKYERYPLNKYRLGFSSCVSSIRQNEYSWLSGIKSISRIAYTLALKEAKEKGYDEAILLNSRGYVCEGSRSNIFLVKNNQIFTPAAESGCLCGITRLSIMDIARKHKIIFSEAAISLKDCYDADEAFLTNSLIGVMPLASIENRRIGGSSCGKVTKFLMSQYGLILRK